MIRMTFGSFLTPPPLRKHDGEESAALRHPKNDEPLLAERECPGSLNVDERRSAKTVLASWNATPSFATFNAALTGSHSNSKDIRAD